MRPVQQQNADLAALDLEAYIPRHVILPNNEISSHIRGLNVVFELVAAAILGSDLEGKRLGDRRGGYASRAINSFCALKPKRVLSGCPRSFSNRCRDQPEAALEEQTLEAA